MTARSLSRTCCAVPRPPGRTRQVICRTSSTRSVGADCALAHRMMTGGLVRDRFESAPMAIGVVAVAVVSSLLIPSCTSETYVTPSTTCSDGPRWPRGTNFEYERNGPTDAPACTPHCGPNEAASGMWSGAGRGRALTSDALPSGACAEDGVVCTMEAEWLGPCPESAQASGPLNLFICRCASGAWACTVDATAPSATAWTCHNPDGTQFVPGSQTDAGSDAATD